VLAVADAAVALTADFAGVTFVRLLGLVVLGPAPVPVPGPSDNREYGWLGRAGVTALAVTCLGPAALPWSVPSNGSSRQARRLPGLHAHR
jgi:hydrogenase-4 component B